MITISIGTLSVAFPAFMDAKVPRIRAEFAAPERSAGGATILKGSAYELPFLWEFQGLLALSDYPTLELLFWEYDDRRRRSAGNPTPDDADNPNLLLIDTFVPVREKTRTRATAPSPNDTVSTIGGSYVEYFAQFNAVFVKYPEILENVYYPELGDSVVVQMLLSESDIVPP
jgi:hypothetical protein